MNQTSSPRDAIRSFDMVFAVIYGGYIVLMIIGCTAEVLLFTPFNGLIIYQTLAAVLVMLLLLVLGWRERRTYRDTLPSPNAMRILMFTRVLLFELFNILWGDTLMTSFLYTTLAITGYSYWGKRASRIILVLASVQFIVRQTLYSLQLREWWQITETLMTYIIFFIVVALNVVILEMIAKERASRYKAESLLDRVEQMHTDMMRFATIEERNRLARDIHDSLGHHLTVIHVQLEKALAYQKEAPDIATQSIQDARNMARTALDDVRQSVTALRQQEKPFSLQGSLQGLAHDMKRIGVPMNLRFDGDEGEFSQQALMTLYRVAQEGVTNSRKHAHATHVEVNVAFSPQEASLVVHDNGKGFDTQVPASGFGLMGLRERLAILSGTLRVQSSNEDGTTLFAQLPRNPIAFTRQFSGSD